MKKTPSKAGRLEALKAHREDLERQADQARAAGDEKALAMVLILLKQCDALTEKAEKELARRR